MTTGILAAWGSRLRAGGASARQAMRPAATQLTLASEVGVVPDNLDIKEPRIYGYEDVAVNSLTSEDSCPWTTEHSANGSFDRATLTQRSACM